MQMPLSPRSIGFDILYLLEQITHGACCITDDHVVSHRNVAFWVVISTADLSNHQFHHALQSKKNLRFQNRRVILSPRNGTLKSG
jgi:hypothetical protein